MESIYVGNIDEKSFVYHQPYLELNTSYYSYKPAEDDPVGRLVWEVYQVNQFDYTKIISIPDACADFMVFYTEEKAYTYVMSGGLGLESMEKMPFMKKVHTIFGVRFYTGALGNLFSVNVQDAGANEVDGLDAFENGQDIVKRIMEAENFTQRWNILSEYLLKRINFDYENNLIVNYVARQIIENHGNVRVQNFEENTGYSGRYLRKLVNEHIGISVKQMCEITKFQWAYHIYGCLNGHVSLSELALQSGYYDQSHMNNSCKKLTGELPRNIMNIYM